jgi:hypothetical protein
VGGDRKRSLTSKLDRRIRWHPQPVSIGPAQGLAVLIFVHYKVELACTKVLNPNVTM